MGAPMGAPMGMPMGMPKGTQAGVPTWTREQAERFWALVQRRVAREPLQHLCGSWDFMGLELAVDRRALIPRPETEILVETVVGRLKDMTACIDPAGGASPAATAALAATAAASTPTGVDPGYTAFVADIGTGTGAIALALAHFCPRLKVLATDLSRDALDLAATNARRLGLEGRVKFAEGDLLAPVTAWLRSRGGGMLTGAPDPGRKAPAGLDALVSNPPYIPSVQIDSLQPEVARHDPRVALDGGSDGLAFYRRLIPGALPLLRPGGGFGAVEVGLGQAQEVAAMFRQAGYTKVGVVKDLAGVERVVLGHRP